MGQWKSGKNRTPRVRRNMTGKAALYPLEQREQQLFYWGVAQHLVKHHSSFSSAVRAQVPVIPTQTLGEQRGLMRRNSQRPCEVLNCPG